MFHKITDYVTKKNLNLDDIHIISRYVHLLADHNTPFYSALKITYEVALYLEIARNDINKKIHHIINTYIYVQ